MRIALLFLLCVWPLAAAAEPAPPAFLEDAAAPNLVLSLRYATADNFTHAPLPGAVTHCYVHAETQAALARAARLLAKEKPGWRFEMFDCARPVTVQRALYQAAKRLGKARYVANPDTQGGSRHGYGLALDLGLLDEAGKPVAMGTGFDFFGEKAHPRAEDALLAKGELTPAQVANRRYLRHLMERAGFTGIPTEWWHFNVKRAKPLGAYTIWQGTERAKK